MDKQPTKISCPNKKCGAKLHRQEWGKGYNRLTCEACGYAENDVSDKDVARREKENERNVDK